jgi:hypothetical protein
MAYFKINLIQFDHKLKRTCCEITASVYVVCWKFSNDVTIFYVIDIWKSDNISLHLSFFEIFRPFDKLIWIVCVLHYNRNNCKMQRQLRIWRSQISVLLAPLWFETIKSQIDDGNSSNTIQLFLHCNYGSLYWSNWNPLHKS